ncbi:MAG: biotin--[acetyl-CoA-carboxylase] ligase [Anaerolineales bacterium]
MLENLHLGWTSFVESTTSTNDIALEWIQQGAPHFSVIATDHQSQGRGRAGRTWYTPPGTALAVSIILRPDIDVQFFSRFTALGTIAVCNILIKICSSQPQIKWPNDVLLQKKKTAGVLTEIVWSGNQPEAVVVGIGVNIDKGSIPPNVNLNFPATYVAAHTRQPLDRFQILYEILSETKTWNRKIDSTAFIKIWEDFLAYRGEKVTAILYSPETIDNTALQLDAATTQNSMVSGILIGITSDGLLTLKLDNGQIRHFAANEIRIQSNT